MMSLVSTHSGANYYYYFFYSALVSSGLGGSPFSRSRIFILKWYQILYILSQSTGRVANRLYQILQGFNCSLYHKAYIFIQVTFSMSWMLIFRYEISKFFNYNKQKLKHQMSMYNQQQNQFPSDSDINQSNQTLNKIANFLEMKNIFINQFWQSNRNFASPQDIQKFCELSGWKLGIHDQINLKNQIFVDREVISIYQFCDLIPQWKKKGSQMIADFLKERSQQLVQSLNAKHKSQRIKSSINSNYPTRPASVNLTSDIKKNRLFSASKQSIKPYKPNNSKKHLEQNRLKSLKKEQQLAETIEKTKNEHEYNMLMKMGQLNEYNHKNKSTTTYRAYKNAEGIIKVRQFQLENFKKQLTIQQFQSQYKVFKKSTKENKQWERPMSSMKLVNNAQDLMSRTLQATFTKNQKKQERQQQLKNLLQNTKNLTKLLQQQIKIFKIKGIYGCQNL